MGQRAARQMGPIIREARERKGWTIYELAGHANVGARTVRRAEGGEQISSAYLNAIVTALGLENLLDWGGIDTYLCSFEGFIAERTAGVDPSSRKFVFDELDHFLDDKRVPSGYFVITGDPGIGKSTFICRLIQKRRLNVYHFNIALQGIDTTYQFLANICARLIKSFNLPYAMLPDGFDRNGAVLNKLLIEVAANLSDSVELVIPVDAVDEVRRSRSQKINPLFLPPALPDHVYFVLTARRREDIGIQAGFMEFLNLDARSDKHREDVERLLRESVKGEGVKAWMKRQGFTANRFVEVISEKSEGNFMYLRHVIPAIEAGTFTDGRPDELPHGLRAYYRWHWTQMKGVDPEAFDRLYEPVVCILAAATESVDIPQVALWTKLTEREVQRVLKEWGAFLHVDRRGRQRARFRLYHAAFREFLEEEVDPGLTSSHTMIAESVLKRLRRRR